MVPGFTLIWFRVTKEYELREMESRITPEDFCVIGSKIDESQD
ncbi:MAG: hypothetical protein ACLUN0_12755 [Roseburia sp.]